MAGILAALSLAPNFVVAEDSSVKVSVSVRTVQVSNVIDQASVGLPLEMDSRLHDLEAKLRTLHYRTFRLISTLSRTVQLERKETMAIGAGNVLTVRPLYMDKDRVGMWLKWKDGAGSEILDTRMHFSRGESMLAGADQTGNSGLLLAIDVKPAE